MEKEIKLTPFYYDYVIEPELYTGIRIDAVVEVGGRFSAKSMNEQRRLIANMGYKEDYKLLVIEDLETGMADGFHAGLREAIRDFEHEPAYNPQSRTAYIKNEINGNEALFKGYAKEQQRLNVKKLNNITEIVVEEGEWLDHNSFISLYQQLRGGKPEDRKLTVLMNPVMPDCYVNEEFILKPADEVYLYFEDEPTRPKVFLRKIKTTFKYQGKDIESTINVLVVISTHHDNPYLTNEQRASIESLKDTDNDKYLQLAEARFIYPKGTLLPKPNYFSLSRLNLDQAARITAIVDTASSGTDSATLGIYADYGPEHHYLIDAIKDPDDAKKVIPKMVRMINKYQPQMVYIEKNHEGLYYEAEIKKGITKNIKVLKFHSTENKHEKILGQSGRMVQDLYIRDDGNQEYNSFKKEMYSYNKDKKKNKHDDCIDNVAMYFKHAQKKGWQFA